MRVILASASPRRRELLAKIGLKFEVIPARGEEKVQKTLPGDVVMELAAQKAQEVSAGMDGDLLIIGSDTVVACEGEILGKPVDENDAARMLGMLSGGTHQVYTGVCLLRKREPVPDCFGGTDHSGMECRICYEKTDVTFEPMSAEEIAAYIATGDPMDKAGAYGIQGICARHIREIRGDYNNVVGLPTAAVYRELKKFLSEKEFSELFHLG